MIPQCRRHFRQWVSWLSCQNCWKPVIGIEVCIRARRVYTSLVSFALFDVEDPMDFSSWGWCHIMGFDVFECSDQLQFLVFCMMFNVKQKSRNVVSYLTKPIKRNIHNTSTEQNKRLYCPTSGRQTLPTESRRTTCGVQMRESKERARKSAVMVAAFTYQNIRNKSIVKKKL